jgi:hypothetical protein
MHPFVLFTVAVASVFNFLISSPEASHDIVAFFQNTIGPSLSTALVALHFLNTPSNSPSSSVAQNTRPSVFFNYTVSRVCMACYDSSRERIQVATATHHTDTVPETLLERYDTFEVSDLTVVFQRVAALLTDYIQYYWYDFVNPFDSIDSQDQVSSLLFCSYGANRLLSSIVN